MPIVDKMRKSNGDPFEEDLLPKAFYYPSQQKDLSERERKTCLSPEPKEKEQVTSPTDIQFLHQSNNFKIHETPTRENGTAADESSSTQFNESWPSTERTTTMASTPETVADSTSETVRLSEIQGWPESSHVPLPNSTLARYIHRFRHSAPSSRQARDRVYLDKGKEGEFWWISSPDSSSTPRQSTPSEGQVPSHSPTLQKRAMRAREGMPPPLTPLTRKLSGGPSTVASSIEGMDTPTKHLQKKAKDLIDKSESTLDLTTSSNGSQPLDRGSSRKMEKDRLGSKEKVVERHTRSHHMRHQCSPPPPPEEDILYQWRLARKMEKAQGRAVQGGSACNSASLRPVLPTSFQLGRPSPSSQIPAAVTSGPSSHPSVTTDHTPLMTSAVELPTVTGVTPGVVLTGVTPMDVHTVTGVTPVVIPSVTSISPAGGTPTQCVTTTLSTPAPGTIPRPDGTPGGDMYTVAGGISPGTSRAAPIQLSTATSMASTTATRVSATPLVGSVGLHGIEQLSHCSCSRALPKTLDIPSHMHLSCDILPCPHDVCVSQQTQYGHPVICGCPVELPVVCPVLTHEHRKRASAGQPVAKGQTTESMKDISVKGKQFKQEHGSHKRNTSGNEIKNKTRCKTKHRHNAPIDGSHIEDTDPLEDYKRKSKHVTQRESPLKGGSGRVVGGRVGNVIGQVVSERLFSTPVSSTNPSEASSPAGSTNEDFGLNEVGEECSDEDFSDDEIVRVLREKMRRYRQELRQIDELLSDQPTR